MRGLSEDVRFAARQFAARPLFTCTAIATIALGIGASAAIFSIVNGLMLNPLPYADSDRLAMAWRSSPQNEMLLTPRGDLVERWREEARSFESIEAWTTGESVVATSEGPRVLRTTSITAGFLDALRMPPAVGRGFQGADELEGAAPIVILTHGFWRAAFGGDAGVLGRTLEIGAVSHTIVGVAEPGFVLPAGSAEEPHLLLPMRRAATGVLSGTGLLTIGRMAGGVEKDRAEAELATIAGRLARDEAEASFPTAKLTVPADMLGESVERALFILSGAVAFVLLIACANVANLLLVRATARESELAVRAALGAARGRLVRQLVVESLMLGTAGGVAGMILAIWGLDFIVAIRPDSLRELERVRIDGRVSAFAGALAIVTSVAFGLLPALRASGRASSGLLRTAGSRVAGGPANRRIAGGLIVAEVALSLVLLVGAGLLVRTFFSLQARPLGFAPEGLSLATIELPPREARGDVAASFREQVRDAMGVLPGVRGAQLVYAVPPDYGVSFGALGIDGAAPSEDAPTIFSTNFVMPEYFPTLGIEFVEGRGFTRDDGDDVVVVGAAFAHRFFEGSALGHRIRLGEEGEWRTIVGVAADLPAQGLARTAGAFDQLHFPARTLPLEKVLIDTDLPAATLVPALRGVLARLNADAALHDVQTLENMLAGSLDRERFNVTMLLLLAVLATLLSAVGLYGVVSVAVAGRTREIGIRRALGASDRGVVRLALAEGMRPAVVGLGLGLIASMLLTGLMEHLLFGLSPHDPVTLLIVPVFLLAVALLASWLPGRRAARIEPVEALRAEG